MLLILGGWIDVHQESLYNYISKAGLFRILSPPSLSLSLFGHHDQCKP